MAMLLFYAGSLRLLRAYAWSSVPNTPPTPFILEGLPSPHTKLTDALDFSSSFPAPYFRPACAPISSINPRYASLSASESNSTIYLALNLLEAQTVLPTFIHELPILLSFMGSHRFHVSILENGSTDLTAGLLMLLAKALTEVGSSYDIVVQGPDMKSNKADGRRIVELARLRNEALESLYNGKAARQLGIKQFDMVLFMNDVFWCASDMLELIQQHVAQESHMTCTTDWDANLVYDRWVARTMSGQPFYDQETLIKYINGGQLKRYFLPRPKPLPLDGHDRKQFGNLNPFQVFSCWNGAAVIDPRAFFAPSRDGDIHDSVTPYQPDNYDQQDLVDKDPQIPLDPLDSNAEAHPLEVPADGDSAAIRFRTARNDNSHITEKASECYLICVDLWRRGMGRILMVPRASVAYKLEHYESVRQDGRRTTSHPLGIESPVHMDISKGDIREKHDGESDAMSHNSSRVQWNFTPPTNVVYHDYAWWHEKERWGAWDEA